MYGCVYKFGLAIAETLVMNLGVKLYLDCLFKVLTQCVSDPTRLCIRGNVIRGDKAALSHDKYRIAIKPSK